MSQVPCEKCGRLVEDGSMDFGIGFALHPTCRGIEVRVKDCSGHQPVMRSLGFISADELRYFLAGAYGQ